MLSSRRIDTFTMRPVKRSYAFEERALPRGLQYVLKVKYPATHAPLPLGLSGALTVDFAASIRRSSIHLIDTPGDTFVGTLGTNTTMLESLLLKRKIMGPTWVLLQGAVHVPASQVSWCKLEVTLSSPKQLLSNPPSGSLPAQPPPLIVAALSLKTVLTGGSKSTNQIVAASCVHQACDLSSAAPLDAWRGGQGMHHFTLVRRLEGQTWPIGACLITIRIKHSTTPMMASFDHTRLQGLRSSFAAKTQPHKGSATAARCCRCRSTSARCCPACLRSCKSSMQTCWWDTTSPRFTSTSCCTACSTARLATL